MLPILFIGMQNFMYVGARYFKTLKLRDIQWSVSCHLIEVIALKTHLLPVLDRADCNVSEN